MKKCFKLINDIVRQNAIKAISGAPIGYLVEIKEESRTKSQNAKLHALISEISDEKEWAGAKRDVDIWKRLLTASWLRAIDEPIEFLPALDGKGVDIVFKKTSQLSSKEMSDLLEYVQAWKSLN